MADQINYYKVLGVSRNASRSEIRNAYRRLAKERHPDHAGGSETEFARLQEAHAVLSDPNRRRQHDEALDLAHAADQLAALNLDFGPLDDEVSQKRRERESQGESGPSLGQRIRNRFRRGDSSDSSGGRAGGRGGRRDRSPQRRARWYEPHDFVAVLVVGGSGGPEGLVRFVTLGIILLLVVIYLGTRRQRAAWRDRS